MFTLYHNETVSHDNLSWDDLKSKLDLTDTDVLCMLDGEIINGYSIEISYEVYAASINESITDLQEIDHPADRIKSIAELLDVSDDLVRRSLRKFRKNILESGKLRDFYAAFSDYKIIREG